MVTYAKELILEGLTDHGWGLGTLVDAGGGMQAIQDSVTGKYLSGRDDGTTTLEDRIGQNESGKVVDGAFVSVYEFPLGTPRVHVRPIKDLG